MRLFDSFVERFHRHFTRDSNARAQLGVDRDLGELPDPTLTSQHSRTTEAKLLLRDSEAVTSDRLNAAEQLDLELAQLKLREEVFHNSYTFNGRVASEQLPDAGEQIGDGLFTLFCADPRPAAERLSDMTSRIEKIPDFLEQTIQRIDTPVARWRDMDLECVSELPGFFDTLVAWAQQESWPDAARLQSAQEQATTELRRYAKKLEQLDTTDQFHIGDEQARTIVRLAGIDLSFEQLHALARNFLATTAETIEDCRTRVAEKHGLDADISAEELHQHLNSRYRVETNGKDFSVILHRYEQEQESICSFIEELNLFPILDEQDMRIMQTPDFMVPLIPAGAMTGPAAFREGVRVSQIFLTLTADRVDDHTELGIPLMMVHEGIPGHHLHLATGRSHSSVVRRHSFASDQAEGWTTMLEDYMLDIGYMEEAKDEARFCAKRDISRIGARVAIDLFFMTGDKGYLDVGVDSGPVADDPFRAAADLLKKVTGFSEARAQAELNWYSTQRGIPLSYLAGNKLMMDLKADITTHSASQGISGLDLDRQFHGEFLRAGLMPIRFMRPIFQRAGLLPN